MQSKKLGRAAAAAALMALLLPSAAFASWWDGGYDGRDGGGYSGRRGDTTTTTHRASPDYESPGESPPPDDNPPSQCGPSGCDRYTPPPDNNAPPPQCGQPECGSPPPPSQCGQSGCSRYTPPPDNNAPPPSDCGQSGCTRYTPPPDNNPPPQCGQPQCGSPRPAPCGQPACSQAPPPPQPSVLGPIYGCENSTLADVQPLLHKTTTPPPGTPVQPGDEILVDITWDVLAFTAPDLHKALDCVYINGHFVPELSGGEKPTPNDGHFAFHYVVPLDVPAGSEICDQGFVSGPQGWEEYGRSVSNVVCFPVDVAPPPPPASCCYALPAETTTTTAPPEEAQPYSETESNRVSQDEVAPPVVLPEQRDVLPRTGTGTGAARLAAATLGLVVLIRRRLR